MSAFQLPSRPYTPLPDDTTLPLQPISPSHEANHRANGSASSGEKIGFPTFNTTSAGEPSTTFSEAPSQNPFSDSHAVPSTAFSQPPSEDPFSDFYAVPVEMSDTGGFPLQRYPNAIEKNVCIYGQDNLIARVSTEPAFDHGAHLRSCGLFAKHPSTFDAEDERRMVSEYVDALEQGALWARTKYCGVTETFRQHRVPRPLHVRLLRNMFGSGVNDAYSAIGGPDYYELWGIYLEPNPFDRPGIGVRVAEVGALYMLRNMQYFRLLPYYKQDWLLEPTEAVPSEETMGEVTEFGDPEAEGWDGEYDETETF